MNRLTIICLLAVTALAPGCGRKTSGAEALLPPETFEWIRQPVAFSPPPAQWERQGDGGAGTVGVRFILRGGGGQCISVAAHRQLAQRDRREGIAFLISGLDSLTRDEFLHNLSIVRYRSDEPISDRDAATRRAVDRALDGASDSYLAGSMGFVAADLETAHREASLYEPTLEELLPHIRLRPETMQHPEWWRIGYERDTLVGGLPAFASDDTLITPDGERLLYHEVFWAVKGCAFKATFQGRQENLDTFHRVVDSIHFPEPSPTAALLTKP